MGREISMPSAADLIVTLPDPLPPAHEAQNEGRTYWRVEDEKSLRKEYPLEEAQEGKAVETIALFTLQTEDGSWRWICSTPNAWVITDR